MLPNRDISTTKPNKKSEIPRQYQQLGRHVQAAQVVHDRPENVHDGHDAHSVHDDHLHARFRCLLLRLLHPSPCKRLSTHPARRAAWKRCDDKPRNVPLSRERPPGCRLLFRLLTEGLVGRDKRALNCRSLSLVLLQR